MNYQFQKITESVKDKNFKTLFKNILSDINENQSISDLIKISLKKISDYYGANNYYFFLSASDDDNNNDLLQSANIQTHLDEFKIAKIIEKHNEINFERLLNYFNDSREAIVTDSNGKLITDINETHLPKYYLCFPLFAGQPLFGAVLFKFEKDYQYIDDQIQSITLLINTFSIFLQKQIQFHNYENSTLQFSRMVNGALNGFYQSTEEGKIIYANPAFLNLTGYSTLEEIRKIDLYKDMYILVEDRNAFIKKMKNEKHVYNYESILKHRDGHHLTVIESSRLIVQSDGTILFEGIIQDITKETELRKKLKYQKSFSDQVLENAPILICAINEDREIILWNRTSEEVTCYMRNEVFQDKNILNLLFSDKEFYNKVLNPEKQKIDTQTFIAYHDFELMSKLGEVKIVRWSSMKMDLDENQKCTLLFGMDITQRKKLENQLFESQKMESLGTLTAGIAYDFNNILGELSVYNSSLKSIAKENSNELIYANKLQDTIEKASTFTSRLIGLSKKDNRKKTKIDVNTLIDNIIDVFEHTAGNQIHLEKELFDDPVIEGDASQIQQAILNLAINAREAIQHNGSIKFKTDIILAKSDSFLQSVEHEIDNYVKITISDSGKGIPKELHRRVFDPFFTTKDSLKSSGLGLSVVYNIIKNHNGFIFVESTPGLGSEFHIYFPSVDKKRNDVRNMRPEPERLKKNKPLILVVDDENIIRDLLNDVLTDHNYEVLQAKDGKMGIELYKEHAQKIDVVLLDIIMPGISGKEVFEYIRGMNPKAKIVITSGYSKQKVTDSLLANGVNGFLPKPFNIEKLLGLVKALIEENQ